MNSIKRYPRRIRKIIERHWDQIKYLFENKKFEEKRNKYLEALKRKCSHEEALMYVYSDKEFNQLRKERNLFLIEGCLFKINSMEFIGKIEYENIYNYYYYEKKHDKIILISYNIYKKRKELIYELKEYRLVPFRDEYFSISTIINQFINNNQEKLAEELYERFL